MSHIDDQFYEAIRTGDTALLHRVIAEDFCLICPTQDHVLSGIYEGKQRFFDEVTPLVFGCVNPEEITFCADHQVVFDGGEVVVATGAGIGDGGGSIFVGCVAIGAVRADELARAS